MLVLIFLVLILDFVLMVAVDLAFTWWCRVGRLLCVLEFASVVVLNLLFDLVWVVGVWAGLFLVCYVGGVIVCLVCCTWCCGVYVGFAFC